MSIIVTGCAGFIGSHTTEELLSRGYNVTGIDCMTYAGSEENMKIIQLNQSIHLYIRMSME